MYCYSGRAFQNMCHYLANLYPISFKFSQNVASDMNCMMKNYRLIAAECADSYATIEMDGRDLSLAKVREFERMCHLKPLGQKACQAFIINEAHSLDDRVVSRLLSVFELPCVQANSVWIFTTTCEGSDLFGGSLDSSPFLSRAVEIPMSRRGLAEAFAERAREIAQREGLDGQPIEKYVRLVKDCRNNLRAMLQQIEAGGLMQ